MGEVLKPEKLSLPDSKVLNLTWIPEAEIKKVKTKLYIESYIRRSNYINLDSDHRFQFRTDYTVTDTPVTLDMSDYALYGVNENKTIFPIEPYTLSLDIHNNHKKFILEFGIRDNPSNTDYKLLEMVQGLNHDRLLLSRPTLKLFDGLEGTELYNQEVLSTKLYFRCTRTTLNVYDANMVLLYTFKFLPGNHLYFKLISTSDHKLQSDLILRRGPL